MLKQDAYLSVDVFEIMYKGSGKHSIESMCGGSAFQQKFDFDDIKCKCKPHVGIQLHLGEAQ